MERQFDYNIIRADRAANWCSLQTLSLAIICPADIISVWIDNARIKTIYHVDNWHAKQAQKHPAIIYDSVCFVIIISATLVKKDLINWRMIRPILQSKYMCLKHKRFSKSEDT